MASFNFSLQDLMSGDSSPFLREQNKHLPTGKPLTTSESFSSTGNFNPTAGMSTLGLGEMMMNVPIFRPQATVASEQQQASSALLQATLAYSDKGSNLGLGGFNQFVPEDLRYAAAVQAASSPNALNSEDTTSSPSTGSSTNNEPDPMTGAQIANNPLFHVEGTAGGALVKTDLTAGNLSPNLMWILALLMTNGIDLTASCARSGLNGVVGTGHSSSPGDLHYAGKAIDLTYFGPPTGSERVLSPLGPITKKVIDIISSVTGPHAVTEFYGPITYNKCLFYAGHETHLHVGISNWQVDSFGTTTKAL